MGKDEYESRFYARLKTDYPCRVTAKGRATAARIVDVALGGASLLVPVGTAAQGEQVSVEVESLEPGGAGAALKGTVVRVESRGGEVQLGVRFDAAQPKEHGQVVELVETIQGSKGAGAREHPRVERRVEVSCRTAEQFDAVMRDLSQGGMALEGRLPLKEGNAVTIEIVMRRFPRPLVLSGAVVHVRQLEAGEVRAGIRFSPLTSQMQQTLDDYLQLLLRGGVR